MDAKKILTIIGFLFAVNFLFGQTWDIQQGNWYSPDDENAGVRKSLQIGDGVGSDSLVGSTGTVIYFPYTYGYFSNDENFGAWNRDTIYLTSHPENSPAGLSSVWRMIKGTVALSATNSGKMAIYQWAYDTTSASIVSTSPACAVVREQNEVLYTIERDSIGGEGDLLFSVDHEGIKSSNYLSGSGEYMLFDRSGAVTVSNLSGVGTRMVTANTNGTLSVQAIPSSSADSLAISGDTLSIIGSNSVILPSSAPDSLAISNDTLSIIGSNSVVLPATAVDGWISDANTWTYSSADAPSFVISVNADMTSTISVGMKISLVQTTTKYFIVTAVGAFGGGATLITVYGGTDYTLVNAAITVPYYSTAKSPFGFPLDPTKWTVVVTDVSVRSQATPTASTWYNIGTTNSQISVPIGAWIVNYKVVMGYDDGAGTAGVLQSTLSTANNSASDGTWTTYAGTVNNDDINATFSVCGYIVVASKTTYYLNGRTTTTGANSITFTNSLGSMVIRARCAYL